MSAAQTTSAFAADAPRYGSEPVDAYYKLNEPGVAGVVTQINPGGSSGAVTFGSSGNTIAVTAVVGGVNLDVVGGGVTAIVAGGNNSTGAVPLVSADGSVLFTNAGGAGAAGSIDMKAVIPQSRTLYGAPATNTVIVGAGAIAVNTLLMELDGLIVGKSYLLNITMTYIISGDFTVPTTAAQFFTEWTYGGAPPNYGVPTAVGQTNPAKLFATYPSYADYKLLAAAATGTTGAGSVGQLSQSLSGLIVATDTKLGLFVGQAPGTGGAGTVTLNVGNVESTFMQATQMD
jgi:hypothetical protein